MKTLFVISDERVVVVNNTESSFVFGTLPRGIASVVSVYQFTELFHELSPAVFSNDTPFGYPWYVVLPLIVPLFDPA